MPQTETRKLAAIMFTDIVGFSRQMGIDEARMLRLLETHNQIIQQAVAEHHGTVIKLMGDAFLVDFPSVVHAVQCAQTVQTHLRTHNREKESAAQIHLRIGIHSGDIVQKEGDVFGDGVNIAARLQELAEPDTVCISDVVYRDVAKKLDLGTVVSLGQPKLKNIAERFPVYTLLAESPKGLRQTLRVHRLKLSHRVRPEHRVVVAALVLIVATIAAGRYLPRPLLSTQDSALSTPAALPLPDKPSIVVLPFANMSKDPEQEYFSDGITEVLTSDLSRIASLFVIARNTAFTYKGQPVNVQDVRRELGVRYVLEGSIQKAADQVRIVAQLIDTATGGHIWSERYDRPLQDLFALQDEIVQKIVTTLKLQLTLWEQGALVRKTTDNPEAYDYLLRGMEYFNRFTREANAHARQMYEKALELDPQYAQAYVSLAFTHYMDWGSQWSQDSQALERAFALAQQAVALDDAFPQAHVILGEVSLWRKHYEQATAELERAIALDPNLATAYAWLGHTLNLTGRAEEAIGLVKKAMRLNPRYPSWYSFYLGQAYLLIGQHEEAVVEFKKVFTRTPDFWPAHADLAVAYIELGREAEAQVEVTEVLRISPQFSLEVARQTWPYKDPTTLERYLSALRKAGLK